MASSSNGVLDPRRGPSPAQSKLRNSTKDTTCRNIAIYGQCRRPGCTFFHPATPSTPPVSSESMKKGRLNVDSPSFTPSSSAATLAPNGSSIQPKAPGISPRAAIAAPFKPKSITPASSVASLSSTSAPKPYNPNAPDWNSVDTQEFIPQSFAGINLDGGSDFTQNDIYTTNYDSTTSGGLGNLENTHNAYQYASSVNGNQGGLLSGAGTSSQILQHHLYAPLDAYAFNVKPYQRTAKDVFIPENLRLRLEKKNEAALRSFPGSQLPDVGYYHSLTSLKNISQRSGASNLPVTSIFRAMSADDGKRYCLRRIHDAHLLRDSEAALAVTSLKSKWSRISNSSIVTAHVAFSTQVFGDASIIVVSDYFPDSVTLRERYLTPNFRPNNRGFNPQISEQLMWNLLVQMTNVLRTIHGMGLAARLLDAKRWLVTDENRIRFNACGLADIVDPTSSPLQELQRADLQQLGKLIFSLGTANMHSKVPPAAHFARNYSPRLKAIVEWLQSQNVTADNSGTIEELLHHLAAETMDTLDASLREDDMLTSTLNQELENSRLVRLMFKINAIMERPEHQNETMWRDQGQRVAIKLFRDYAFHQVDANGNPVNDMGHMLACMNKLDVGIEEKIMLIGREQTEGGSVLIVSYREMKQVIESAWSDLAKRSMS